MLGNPTIFHTNSDGSEVGPFCQSVRIARSAFVDPSAMIQEDVTIGPLCHIGPNVKIDEGVFIEKDSKVLAWAGVGPNCKIGRRTTIGHNAWIEGNSTLLHDVTIGTKAILGSEVLIEEGVRIGESSEIESYASIRPFCKIGSDCTVGEFMVVGANAEIEDGLRLDRHTTMSGFWEYHWMVWLSSKGLVLSYGCEQYLAKEWPHLVKDLARDHEPNYSEYFEGIIRRLLHLAGSLEDQIWKEAGE